MADGSGIKVDFGTVEAASQQITSQANQVDQHINDLQQQISNLQQIWEGSSSEGFQHTKNQWMKAAQDLQQTLAAIGTAVGTAHQNYT
ncbi:MAG: WXG100 family type VII secretion target, partial [Sciscionella sp.]